MDTRGATHACMLSLFFLSLLLLLRSCMLYVTCCLELAVDFGFAAGLHFSLPTSQVFKVGTSSDVFLVFFCQALLFAITFACF